MPTADARTQCCAQRGASPYHVRYHLGTTRANGVIPQLDDFEMFLSCQRLCDGPDSFGEHTVLRHANLDQILALVALLGEVVLTSSQESKVIVKTSVDWKVVH